MKSLILFPLLFVVLFSFSQTKEENKSKVTLDMSLIVKDSLSKIIKGATVDIYIAEKKIKTVDIVKKFKINWKLYLQNEYKVTVSANGYESKTFFVDTRMSKSEEEKNSYGFDFPMGMTLEKKKANNNSHNQGFVIYYNENSGYFYFKSTYDLANEQLKAGHYKEAIELFTKVITKDPKDVESYYNRGICYTMLGDKESACADWNKCKELGNKEVDRLIQERCAVQFQDTSTQTTLETYRIRVKYRDGANPIIINTQVIMGSDTTWAVKRVLVEGELVLDTNQLEQLNTVLPLSSLNLKHRSWIFIEFIKIKGSKFQTVSVLNGNEQERKDSWWRR